MAIKIINLVNNNIKVIAKQWPKFWDKKKAFIGDNLSWMTFIIYYYVYNNICKSKSIDFNFYQCVIYHLYKLINNN